MNVDLTQEQIRQIHNIFKIMANKNEPVNQSVIEVMQRHIQPDPITDPKEATQKWQY